MGTVYAVEDVARRRRLAVKKLHRAHLENDNIRKRFQRESALLATLSHPGICPVLRSGFASDGTPYFAMPLLRGTDLARLIGDGKRPGIEAAVHIACALLDALEYAHGRGVLHRDIKPGNVFVCESEADGVKLLDFGISKIADESGTYAEITTATGAVLGTPHYMAPEQARGVKHIDHRADLFSVGVILYEMLAGRKPFEGRGYNDVIIKLVSEPFVPPSRLNSDVPPAVERIVLRAMSRHPDDRYGSAAEMRDALRSAMSDATGADATQGIEAVSTAHEGGTETPFVPTDIGRAGMTRWRSRAVGALVIAALVGCRLWRPVFDEAKSKFSAPPPSPSAISARQPFDEDEASPQEIGDAVVSAVPISRGTASAGCKTEGKKERTPPPPEQPTKSSKRPNRPRSSGGAVKTPGSNGGREADDRESIPGRLGTKIVTTF